MGGQSQTGELMKGSLSKKLSHGGILAVLLIAAIGAIGAIGAWYAPFLYAEYFFDLHGHEPTVAPKPLGAVTGRWIDDYFVVQDLDQSTFAIGEPRYYQGNYSYLILGDKRAVLFDAGSSLRDIVPVVRSLTTLPVTVIPSHLHFDHVGALGRLDRTALLDSPSLRARIRDSRLTLLRYEFLGFADRLTPPTFRVDEWWAQDSTIDLGGRLLRVTATPGHTPTSISLYDEERRALFVGDFIYPGGLYVFLPGASREAYAATTSRLLAMIHPDTRVFAAHMDDTAGDVQAPVLGVEDLKALQRTLIGVQQGALTSHGFYPRVFPVRGTVTLETGWAWNNR